MDPILVSLKNSKTKYNSRNISTQFLKEETNLGTWRFGLSLESFRIPLIQRSQELACVWLKMDKLRYLIF